MSTNPPDAHEPFRGVAAGAEHDQEAELLSAVRDGDEGSNPGDNAEREHSLESSESGESGESADGAERLDGDRLRGAIEAILLVVDEPVSATMLASVLAVPEPRVLAALSQLAAEYDEAGRGFEAREVAGGWRFYTREEFAPIVERFLLDGQQARLTQAALETLAVVAYRQPVSRVRVSAVRGVNVDGVMRTLLSRGLVEEAGSEDSGAVLYQTTSYFLERLGLRSLDELPNLANFLPESTTIEDLENEISSSGRDD